MNNTNEFKTIIEPILAIEEFQGLRRVIHHEGTRYDHSLRVAYGTYLITKKLHLNYKEATEAALLHDFFSDEVKEENGVDRLRKHPAIAVENASKYFLLTPLQKDIILTHMFPITFRPPKYLESWIVDIVDDIAAIYEKVIIKRKQISAASCFLFLLTLSYIRIYLYN